MILAPGNPARKAQMEKMQMSDTANTTAKPEKRKVADHYLLGADGTVVKTMEEAVGIRYVSINRPQQPFDFIFEGATAGSALAMLACFGAKTKATNEASRVRNGEGGGDDEQLSAIEEVFESLKNGVWREKGEGGGSRIDRQTVAEVLVSLLGDKADGTVDTIAQRFTDGHTTAKHGKMTGEQYFKLVWSNDKVKAAYRTAKGQTGPALDDLA